MDLETLADFRRLLHDEFSLDLGDRDMVTDLRDIPAWDSVLLLQLITLVEEETGRRLSVRSVLEARTFEQIHDLVKEQA
ncbi:acyl carrier protein [Streptomyces sp. NPDC048111]|uniref:acyl carrier protein n=1 Tax=Streptomyces sp. NPDC048111 TaxID=3365500 RepID=UPI00371C729E